MIDLIEKAARNNYAIMPCHKDWDKSFTVDDGKLRLWFNVPCGNNFTTKMIEKEIKEDKRHGD